MKQIFLFFFIAYLCASANEGTAMPLAHQFKNVEMSAHTSNQSICSKKVIAKISAAKPLKNVAKTARTALIMGLISVGSLFLLMLGFYLLSPVLNIVAILFGIIFGIAAFVTAAKVLREKDIPKKYRSMAMIGSIAGIVGALMMTVITVLIIMLLATL